MSGLYRDGFRLRLSLPEGVTEEQVMVEYFSTTRWDGAVDLSWYNGTDTEFTVTTARQLAGVAEPVNSNTTDFTGKTIRLGGGYLPAAV